MPVGTLTLQPKPTGNGLFTTAVLVNSVEVASANNNADLVLQAANSFGQTETIDIAYPTYTVVDGNTVAFGTANAQVSGKMDVVLTTKLIKKSSHVFVKEVTVSSGTSQLIAITNKVTGNALSYYTFRDTNSPSVPAFTSLTWGASGTQHYDHFQAVGMKTDADNVLVLAADDGWSARWNIGVTNANSYPTRIETNALSINYGFSNSGNTIRLEAGVPLVLRFIYSLAAPDAYSYRKDIQINWAIAKDCPYTDDFRRILWTTARVNLRTANTTEAGQRPFAQPSWYWSVAQWMRDSFWTSLGIDDGPLCHELFETMRRYSINWSNGMVCGALLDSLTIWGISIDDSILHFLSWAYWLKKKYNITALTTSELNSVVANVVSNLNAYGRFRTVRGYPGTDTFAVSWHDAMGTGLNYNETAYNQGWCCVALRAAKELGGNVTDADIEKAKLAYRSFYKPSGAPTGGYINTVTFDGTDANRLDSASIMGEAFYTWWFNESLLGGEIVLNQWRALQQGKVMDGFKSLSMPDGSYVTTGTGTGAGNTGSYQNGGIWLWLDFCNFYTAMYHGVAPEEDIVAQWNARVNREFAVIPAVQEALDTMGVDNRNIWGVGASYNVVYGWNAAILAMLDTFSVGSEPPAPPPPEIVGTTAVSLYGRTTSVQLSTTSTGPVRFKTETGVVSVDVDPNSPVRIKVGNRSIGLKR